MEPHLGDAVTSRVAGMSAEGREIRHLTYGDGPVQVLLWSQMHGNESTASMALADIIRFFDEAPDHALARRVAEGATIHMVPMLNPDGAERFQRRNAIGVDINRDARRLATPEARILKEVRDQIDADFGFNLHDQNPHTQAGREGPRAAIALLAPAADIERSWGPVRARARSVAAAIAGALEQEQFLELMLTQLKNRVPLKPMESGEFLGYLAQFGTVSGIGEILGLTSCSKPVRSRASPRSATMPPIAAVLAAST